MMRFIEADGIFYNLAAVLMIEDVTDYDDINATGPLKARITPLVGDEVDIDDATELFDRLNYLTQETQAATNQLKTAAEILDQARSAAQGGIPS